MFSKITSKYQVTIPREVRESLKLTAADTIEWNIGEGRVIVTPGGEKPFLKYRGSLRVGRGDIKKDIMEARKKRALSHA